MDLLALTLAKSFVGIEVSSFSWLVREFRLLWSGGADEGGGSGTAAADSGSSALVRWLQPGLDGGFNRLHEWLPFISQITNL